MEPKCFYFKTAFVDRAKMLMELGWKNQGWRSWLHRYITTPLISCNNNYVCGMSIRGYWERRVCACTCVYSQLRASRPASVTGVSHRLRTCKQARCSESSRSPASPNWQRKFISWSIIRVQIKKSIRLDQDINFSTAWMVFISICISSSW